MKLSVRKGETEREGRGQKEKKQRVRGLEIREIEKKERV